MPHNLLHTFLVCIVTMIMGLSLSGVSAQSFYQIYGPQVIQDICERYDYGIVTDPDTELVHTEWLLSNGEVLSGSAYYVTIQFPAAGTYILYASSTSDNGEILRDSMLIQVYGQSFTPEVIGCYELNLSGSCYRVCAGSITTIVPPTNANFEVTGAESYQYVNGNLEVTWGDGGEGYIIVSYFGSCETGLCFDILPEPYADFTTSPPSLQDTITVCKGQEILFENLSVNGLSYSWDFGDGEKSNQANALHTYAEEGLYTVILDAETVCSCVSQKQVWVEVLPAIAPTLDCINSICPGTRQHYTATAAGCSTYLWSVSGNGTIVNGGGVSDDFIEIIWHDGPEGIIELSVDNCISDHCSEATVFRIPVITPDGPVRGDTVVCAGSTKTYEAPYFPGTQYHWDIAGYSIVYGTDIIHDTICGNADYDFLLVANCSDVFIIQQEEMCAGDSILIENEWISDEGVYSFTLTDGSTGCDSLLDVYVNTLNLPIIQSIVDWNCISLGQIELQVEGAGPFQYVWNSLVDTDSLVNGLPDGTYTVSVADSNGCISFNTSVIEAGDPLNFSLPSQYEIEIGDSLEIVISGDTGVNGLEFQWSAAGILECASCTSSFAYPFSDTTIIIQITDADSCQYFLETKIVVREDSSIIDDIYAPNVFSPNGDGINDRFTFFSRLPDVYVYELTIMDRWGELVYHVNDIDLNTFPGWDGTLRDKMLNPGVFVYFARVKLSDGQEVRLVGDVTLLK